MKLRSDPPRPPCMVCARPSVPSPMSLGGRSPGPTCSTRCIEEVRYRERLRLLATKETP